MSLSSRIRSATAVSAAIAAFVLVPSAANAGVLVQSAPDCAAETLTQPFLPWADLASYTLDNGGSFEDGGAGWTLGSGASVVSGNEPWNVTSSSDSQSLSIASGSQAVSSTACVGVDHPTIRFFANGSNSTARLYVEVLFESSTGAVVSAPVGLVTGSNGWAPTTVMPIAASLLPLLPGNYTPVQFRFTASGGSFQIDDLYIDPYSRS